MHAKLDALIDATTNAAADHRQLLRKLETVVTVVDTLELQVSALRKEVAAAERRVIAVEEMMVRLIAAPRVYVEAVSEADTERAAIAEANGGTDPDPTPPGVAR